MTSKSQDPGRGHERTAVDALCTSNEGLRVLLELGPVAVYSCDASGVIQDFNRRAADLWGRAPAKGNTDERFCGSLKMFRPDGTYLPHDCCPMAEVLSGAIPFVHEGEVHIERPDGSRVVVSMAIHPLKNNEGEITGAINCFYDITERKRTEVALRESEAALRRQKDQFTTLVEHIPDIVSRLDRNLRYLYISPAVEAMTGTKHEDYIGKPRTNFGVAPEFAAIREQLSRKVFETGQQQTLEFPIASATGMRNLEMRLLPEFAPDGSVESLMTLTRDVTERKQAEETQRLLLGELSHRVKNTLATVQAIAQQTLRRTTSPEQFVASFSGRVQALARVHTLLTNTTWQGADLRELIRDQVLLGAIDESRLTAWGPSITLGPEMALHMAMVLHELATNSFKYGALSGGQGSVTVSWLVKGEELQLRWQERGGPPVEVSKHRGFGSQMIEQSAKAHQGSAEMLSEKEGVSWIITLPLQAERPWSVANTFVSADQPARAMIPTTNTPMVGKRVLVVEDEPLIALDVVSTLQDVGIEAVGPAGTVEEALRLIDTGPLHAALVDVNLHGRPVDDIAAALTRRDVPFAFMTGNDRKNLPQAFRDALMVAKPYMHEALLEMITKLVATRHRRVQTIPFRGRPD